ncbi:MAG TPA: M48 family metallopeptidase, partial [Candidatus Omnitrophota bacterium]|nr:M48 family metallopeptidase [Candidatus Omnitrophota bacterium]
FPMPAQLQRRLSLFLIVVQVTGISAAIKDVAFKVTASFYPALAVYFSIFSALSYIVTFPVHFYSGFLLEHRFALSNQTVKRWFVEEAKGYAISFVITLAVVEALYLICRNFEANWWIPVSVFWILFTVGFAKIFPVVIMPLFYKCVPLKNEELKNKIFELAGRFNIKISDVFEIDFSKNTRKSNAAVIGWGKTRRVVLTDNLINDFTPDEVEVVAAHEFAHYALGHIQKLVSVQILSTVIFFYGLSLIMPVMASILGASDQSDILILPAIWFLLSLYSFTVAPILNAYSRKLEEDADRSAIEATKKPLAFISLMKRLSEKNLSDDSPSPLVEYLFYNHPPISKRIRMGEEYAKK